LIVGVGTDIIEINRIKKQIESNESFVNKIFTKHEIAYCEQFKSKAQNYAVRFAAKEAFLKAIGKGWRDGLAFDQVEVVNDELGKPDIKVSGKAAELVEALNVKNIQVSLSHSHDNAIAFVILEN
jgi:holo-[acyl-carrier protein] synthase